MKKLLPFLIFFLPVLMLFATSSNAYSDGEVLLKLKSFMVAPSGSGLDDWLPSSSPSTHCSFFGVSCNDDFRVVALNVTAVPLLGIIPPEIRLLDALVNLTLAANNLSGTIPLQLSNLTSLQVLNISNNKIYGGFPNSLTLNMPHLQILDFYNNNFSGPLPTSLAKLTNLKHLHLGGNYFSGPIPAAYSEFQSLIYLGLNTNGLSGPIPSGLSKLSHLQEMYLGYSNCYSGGIPHEFGELKSLRVLDMGSCNLTGQIPASLSQLGNLDSLFLEFNRLTGYVPPELSGLVSLKSLDLSNNDLIGEIPLSFSELRNITLINLFRNHMTGPIPEFIGDLPHLEVLQVWENNFTFKLPANLGRNGKLKLLDVTMNHLTGTIPRDLCKGGNLQSLILMDTFFFGSIPNELGDCKSLTKIRIVRNFLSGSIPAGLFNLPNLSILELNDNYFTGELPRKMSGNALELLDVSNNRIDGEIPPAIGQLVNLQTLSLEINKFSGRIPGEISKLKLLSNMNFSANHLNGTIPNSISECTSLTRLDFSVNNLVGELPGDISKLRILSTLDLSGNRLTGTIPSEIGSMVSLTTLDLSNNNFIGHVPTGGQFLVFNDTSFAGNPNLCFPRHNYCPVVNNGGKSKGKLTPTNLIITLTILITLVSCLAATFIRIRRRKLQKSRAWKMTTFQRLDFRLEDVLECLQEENVIGKGGAGVVYRGTLPYGLNIAIKRLTGRGQNDHGFSAEIQILGRIRHRNIVRLLGYVSNVDTNLLLYEYMPNGSLGELLHGPKGGHLMWETRYRIAVESARGLCYLHHDCSPLILHRDVKSNNILLDSHFEAHVADFGLAKFLQDPGSSECMSSVAGSYGYIAPEYAYTLKVDEKSDVYSFGVVLMELITGRKPVGDFGDGVDIVMWVRKTISELSQPSDTSAVLGILDSRLSEYNLTSVVHLFKIAMLCVEDESSARPTMREVVYMLTNPPPQSKSAAVNLLLNL